MQKYQKRMNEWINKRIQDKKCTTVRSWVTWGAPVTNVWYNFSPLCHLILPRLSPSTCLCTQFNFQGHLFMPKWWMPPLEQGYFDLKERGGTKKEEENHYFGLWFRKCSAVFVCSVTLCPHPCPFEADKVESEGDQQEPDSLGHRGTCRC